MHDLLGKHFNCLEAQLQNEQNTLNSNPSHFIFFLFIVLLVFGKKRKSKLSYTINLGKLIEENTSVFLLHY